MITSNSTNNHFYGNANIYIYIYIFIYLKKEFLFFFKKSILGGVFLTKEHLLIPNGHGRHIVMLVCMASYMMAGYGHTNHAFRVNVPS
jgi:hypothetical protein